MRKLIILLAVYFLPLAVIAQSGYKFTDKKVLPTTPVKNQYRSGTCWSFSGLSFFESELLRLGKEEYNLSEMFVVRMSYEEKAKRYVRMHGSNNFAGGGAFNDVQWTLKNVGIVPEEIYSGLDYGEEKHVHGEMDTVLQSYINGVIANKNKKLSTAWFDGYKGILDAYLGAYPESFNYKGKEYTPQTFVKELGLNMDDYVMITSFTHHPFYESFILEIPDNWGWGEVYNVRLNELTDIIDYAIDKGFTVAWATDVSEKGFQWKKGFAVVPEDNIENLDNLERSKWDELSILEQQKQIYNFSSIRKEKEITQELRQVSFDNYETTDDHGMHIVGIATDQEGNYYYKVKNSWSDKAHIFDGYLYASKAFVQFKTTSLLLHKDAIPSAIRKKLGI